MATIDARMKQWHRTEAEWASENPTLLDGEVGFVSDADYFKVGDGSTAWDGLRKVYFSQTPITDVGASLLVRDSIFGAGQDGTWLEAIDGLTFTDDAGTILAGVGDPIGQVKDRTSNGHDATQTGAERPTRRKTPNGQAYIEYDGVDDGLEITVPAGGWTGSLYYAGDNGRGAFGVDLSAGTYSLLKPGGGEWDDNVFAVVIRNGALSASEEADLNDLFSYAGPVAWDTLTNGSFMFRDNSLTSLPAGMTLGSLIDGAHMFRNNSLTSLPAGMTLGSLIDGALMFRNNSLTSLPSGMTLGDLLDGSQMFQGNSLTALPAGMTLSSLTVATYMFHNNGLTSLPSGMTLSDLTSGSHMFRDNITLTTVPSDFASLSDCTDWENAFTGTNLTQASIDNILTNLDARGTSNGTFDQSGGSAPSSAGETAIDNMRGRGWTINVTGGY